MRILKWLTAVLGMLTLVACGGGGGSAGTSLFGTGSTTPTTTTSAAVSVDVLSSAVQLGSSGDQVTVTAVVKGPGNVSLAGVPVAFSSDSGNLTSAATVTDSTGIATATLSAGADKSNRNITVTASSGAASGSVVIPVVTTLATTAAATSIDVLASAVQLGTGGDQVTISAIVKGAGNVSLPAVPVSFSADSGILLSPASVTDASGVATATLSTGSDKSNRNIKVTVLSGSVSGSIVVPVAGTALAYAGVTTVTLGSSVTVGVKATDSRGAVIAGLPVTIRSSLGNALSAASATTDAQGSATVRYTATNAGTDTLTFQAAGATAAPTLQISAENFVFVSPAANTQIVVGSSYPVSVRYLSNGVAQSGKTVLFTATAGTVSPTSAVTDASGLAVTTVTASTAGPAIVQASYSAPGVNAQATLPIEFIAQTPAKLVLQVTPTALGPNPVGTTAQQAQVLATVTDANGNPVKGTTVNFTRTSDPSAGSLNQASAVTDSNGQASVQYVAGALTTASNGVALRATVASNEAVSGTATLTVNQSALFIALGTGNTISNLDEQTYKKDWVVYVTDANGVAVPNISLTIKVLPVGYCKGELVFDTATTTWVVPSSARYFANEDLDFNGILSPGEDSNGNGVLDPGNVISVTTATSTTAASSGTVRTDSTGRATVSLVYAESYAPWVRVKLRAEAVVTGTESSKEAVFFVTGSSSDFSSQTIPPAGKVSPFGSAVSSSGTSCLSAP